MKTFSQRVVIVLLVLLVLVSMGGLCLGFALVSGQRLGNLKALLRAKGEKLTVEDLSPEAGTNDLTAHREFM